MSISQELFTSIGQNIPEASPRKIFGNPCYLLNGKAFICLFHKDVVLKLDDSARRNALALEGAKLFDPSGKKRPMKEWVQLPYSQHQYWGKFAQSAANYIVSL